MHRRTPLDEDVMAPVRAALDTILRGHEPFPAVVVDHRWDLVSANGPALAVLTGGVDPALLERPNALRITLHPDGLAPRIANLAEWSAHLLGRLRREAHLAAGPELHELHDELAGYPGVDPTGAPHDPAGQLFVPLRLRPPDAGGPELRFFGTVATFGTALDLTLTDLAIESFFPADAPTEQALRDLSHEP